jgi:uncharacterized protein
MLISFSVRNYLSFRTKQCVAYNATSDRSLQSGHCMETHYHAIPRLNRSAVLFGASASGKTNCFLALLSLCNLMRNSLSYTEAEFAAQYMPFRFDASDTLPTEFDIDLLIDRVRYRYSIALNSQRIVFERLLVYKARKAQRWFERRVDPHSQLETWATFSNSLAGARGMWRRSTSSRVPFLVSGAKLNAAQFLPLFHWFQSQIEFVLDSADSAEFESLIARLTDAHFKSLVLKMLQAVGIPVSDIRLVSRGAICEACHPRQAALITRPLFNKGSATVELQYTHLGEAPVWMPLASEAAGTQRLFSLLRPLLDSSLGDRLIVIDNFDAALHPLVTRFLLKHMNSSPAKSCPVQLLLSSHDTALMDLSLLRREEMWLVDLDASHASQLSSLATRRLRKTEAVGKHYLSGRYGGVPIIKELALASTLPSIASA